MKKLLYSLIAITCITIACKKDGGNAAIQGIIKNAADGKVILEDIGMQNLKSVDTALIKGGKFTLSYKTNNPRIMRVRFADNKSFMFIYDGKNQVNVDGDINDLTNLTVKGSNATKSYYEFQKKMTQAPDPAFAKNFVDTVSHPLVALLCINNIRPEENLAVYEKLRDKLQKELPNNDYTVQFTAQVQSMKAQSTISSPGAEVADIELPDPKGKMLKLSSLKGKVVLIDFWASWCRPCRMENPNVVKAYNKYKNKGFTVFSVSLDNNKEKWVAAIGQDGLIWPNHVSELKGWQSSVAGLYGVNSIPRTFLIDKEGKLVASNLRGEALESKLAELLN